MIYIRILAAHESAVLGRVADGVFDNPIDEESTSRFLEDPRHHLVVAIDSDIVVGFASGVDYCHPDKPPELWINEIGVAPTHRRAGLGRKLLKRLLDHGHDLGCRAGWILTDHQNLAAQRLYASFSEADDGEDSLMFSFRLARTRDSDEPD